MVSDMNSQSLSENKDVKLIDLFFAIWSRKCFVFMVIIISVGMGVLASYLMPNIYRVYLVIKPGILDISEDGKRMYLDSIGNIKAKIESKAYEQRLRNALRATEIGGVLTFHTSSPTNTDILNISLDVDENSIESGKKILQCLVSELQNDYSLDVQNRRTNVLKDISILKNEIKGIIVKKKDMDKVIAGAVNEIKNLNNQIESQKATIVVLKAREKELIHEIEKVQKNSEKLTQAREVFLQNHNSTEGVAEILYVTTIQQNISFYNDLQSQLNDLRMKIEDIKGTIKSLEKYIGDKRVTIERLELEKTEEFDVEIASKEIEIQNLENKNLLIQNIVMISQPSATAKPVKPNRPLNIIISAVVGCFIGFILAFFLEYVERAREYKK